MHQSLWIWSASLGHACVRHCSAVALSMKYTATGPARMPRPNDQTMSDAKTCSGLITVVSCGVCGAYLRWRQIWWEELNLPSHQLSVTVAIIKLDHCVLDWNPTSNRFPFFCESDVTSWAIICCALLPGNDSCHVKNVALVQLNPSFPSHLFCFGFGLQCKLVGLVHWCWMQLSNATFNVQLDGSYRNNSLLKEKTDAGGGTLNYARYEFVSVGINT